MLGFLDWVNQMVSPMLYFCKTSFTCFYLTKCAVFELLFIFHLTLVENFAFPPF